MVFSSFSDTTVGIDTVTQLPGTLLLPPVRSKTFVSQRHEVNPALALNLLNDIQSQILLWQDQLRQLVKALHTLYAQGPMVEGWLESTAETASTAQTPETTLLRHGDTNTLLQYIELLDSHSKQQNIQKNREPRSSNTEYRLCKLDENGQVRSQPCPPEQTGTVSIAIARYQKFKQLLDQKEAVDAKLKQAVDLLTGVRTSL